jgi:tetratricopeptide (TPR) repeat protein
MMKIMREIMKDPIAMMLAVLLLVMPPLRFAWDLLPQTVVHVSLLAGLVYTWSRKRIDTHDTLHRIMALLFLAALASVVECPDKASGRNELLVLADGLAMAYLTSFLNGEAKRRLFAAPVVVGIWFAVLLVIFYLWNGMPAIGRGILPAEFAVNPEIIAGYLSLCLPLCYTLDRKNRSESMLGSGFILLGIALTGSRAALFMSGICFLWCARYVGGYRWRRLLPVALAVAVVAVFIAWRKYGISDSLADRIVWYRTAIAMFAAHPLTGAGWGNFASLYQMYRPGSGLSTMYAHNIVLQILAESGVAGLTVFGMLIYAFFRRVRAQKDGLALPVAAAVTSFLAVNLADYSFYIPGVMMLFWFCVGSVVFTPSLPRKPHSMQMFVGIAVLLAAAWFLTMPFRGSFELQKGVYEMRQGNCDDALRRFARAIRIDPIPAEPYRRRAEAYYAKYTSDGGREMLFNAIAAQEDALQRCRFDGRAWADLGVLYWTAGEREKAIASARRAVAADRYNPKYGEHLRYYITALQ